MHLSKEIQSRLDKLNSGIQLSRAIDGTFPDKYSFYKDSERSFRTGFAATNQEFSIVLFERTDKLSYENCFGRGLFHSLDRLAHAIRLWTGDQADIRSIESQFKEIEVYKDFDFRNPNPEIDKAWSKVKNMSFNTTDFWKDPGWNERYLELLTAAKRHNSLQNYFPFRSHDWLRFSKDKDIKETWPLDLYMIPTVGSAGFYVSHMEKPKRGQSFDRVSDALDFYVEKLRSIKPTKWR